MNYYEHHLGDYDGATAHLSWIEDCAYRRLICLYYRSEQPIPADLKQACRLVRAASKGERDAVQQVLSEFFTLADDGWHNTRCDEDIARFRTKQAKARASADARWNPMREASERNANASPEHDASHMRTHSERNANGMHRAPVPSPQTPDPIPSEPKVPRGRGSRLPADWDPGEAGFAFAAQQGLTNGRAQAELEKFRDHWAAKTGADASKADWQATWRNWVRKAMEFAPKTTATQVPDDIFGGSR